MLLQSCVFILSLTKLTIFAQTLDERMNLDELVQQVFGSDADGTSTFLSKCGLRNSEGLEGSRRKIPGKTEFG